MIVRTLTLSDNTIFLGYRGSHDVLKINIDISEWTDSLGVEGTVVMKAMRSGDTVPYPVANVSYQDGIVAWDVDITDTGFAGKGKVQVDFVSTQGGLARTKIFTTFTEESIGYDSVRPADYDNWYDQLSALLANAEASAYDSAESANRSEEQAGIAEEAAGRAEDALHEFVSVTAVAESLPEGAEATAEYLDGVLTFGIPTGATGAQGPQGERGPQGPKGDPGEVTQVEFDALDDEVTALKADFIQIADREVLFDYSTNNYTVHGGSATDGNVYIIKTDISSSPNRSIIILVNVYKSCDFYIGLVSKLTGTVLYGEVFTLKGGINAVKLNYAPEEVCYLILDQGKDKLLYSSGTNITYVFLTGRSSYPAVGERLLIGGDLKADFAVGVMKQVNIEYIENATDALTEDVLALTEDISILNTSVYASEAFDYNENATVVSSFLLLQPAPYDGTINKIYFKRGSNGLNVEITVYEWAGSTVSTSSITVVERYTVNVIDGVAEDVDIPIQKGQYIGVSRGSSSVCTWYSTLGAGFVYTPETASTIRLYNNTYITLSYEMTVEGSVAYTANKVFDERTAEKGIAPFDGKNIFLAGDSRSSTDYTFYGTTLKAKTGANVLVKGASGTGAAYQASNTYFSQFTGTEDFVIWLTGGNDTGEIVGTFDADYPGLEGQTVVTETDISQDYNGSTFIQAVDHMMRKWKSLYYDWKTLNNGHKPTLIFCSEIPQQRANANTEWSKKENWIRKCLAIRQCCEKNGVFYLDLYNICNFDMSFEPFWVSPTDKVTNNGLYYMDGLHPNKYGIDLITSAEIEAMKNFIRVNA